MVDGEIYNYLRVAPKHSRQLPCDLSAMVTDYNATYTAKISQNSGTLIPTRLRTKTSAELDDSPTGWVRILNERSEKLVTRMKIVNTPWFRLI